MKPLICHTFTAFLISAFFFSSSSNSFAATPSNKNSEKASTAKNEKDTIKAKEQCIFGKKQITAALVAKDWLNLERLAKAYVKDCSSIQDQEDLAVMHGEIARANNRLERPKEALVAAESCINLNYSNPECHIQKSEALIQQRKTGEYIKELEVAERLAEHALSNARRDREQAFSELEKEDKDSNISLHESQLYYIKRAREQLLVGDRQ